MQPRSRGTADLELAKSHFRAVLGARNENAPASRFWGAHPSQTQPKSPPKANPNPIQSPPKPHPTPPPPPNPTQTPPKAPPGPPRIAPWGIFVGTLAPKTALKCDFVRAPDLRSHGSVAAFLQPRAPSNERCDAAHFHSGWLWTAFRGVWGVL